MSATSKIQFLHYFVARVPTTKYNPHAIDHEAYPAVDLDIISYGRDDGPDGPPHLVSSAGRRFDPRSKEGMGQ